MVVVDACRAWRPPFNPSGVVAECVDLLRSYRLHEVTGDKYAAEWPVEQFRKHGCTYRIAERDRSALYLEMLATVNAAGVELPDLGDLLRELRSLERRRGSSGKDRVDHRPGSHDDLANAVAGVMSLLPARTRGELVAPDYQSGPAAEEADDRRDSEGAVLDTGGTLSAHAELSRKRWPSGW